MHSTCTHYAKVDEETGAVALTNDDDSYYYELFTSRAKLEAFITELRKVADQAFGIQREMTLTSANGRVFRAISTDLEPVGDQAFGIQPKRESEHGGTEANLCDPRRD